MDVPLRSLNRRHWLKTMGTMFAGTTVPLSHAISSLAEEPAALPIRDIGSRRELFVDSWLIARLEHARLVLHRPQPQEVAFQCDQPWETAGPGYPTVLRDGDRYRLYYRCQPPGGSEDGDERQVTCYAESSDGVSWTKPNLGLFEFQGSKENNIVWRGALAHNFTPFRDSNPDCAEDEQYKAVGGVRWGSGGLWALVSPDGIHWRKRDDRPLPLAGNFDSQNVVFWDAAHALYRAYWRDHRRNDPRVPDGRDVRTAVSEDFVQWSERRWLDYDPGRNGTTQKPADPQSAHQFYTNGIQPYHRAPHLLLGFPMRYIDRGWRASTDALPDLNRRRELADKNVGGGRPTREGTALTDVMFMASRDGERFFVWPEAMVRPGIQRPGSWFYGSTWYSQGIVETEPLFAGAPRELSIYVSENAHQETPQRLRRYTFRIDGFASAHASLQGGELLTKPITFDGDRLQINFATSAGGSLQVEIQDADGNPVPGVRLADCHEQFGDELERIVSWKSGTDVSKLSGKPVRLRFVLKDADLYSFQFTSNE